MTTCSRIKIFSLCPLIFIWLPFDLLKSTNSDGQRRDRGHSHPDFSLLGFVYEFLGLNPDFIFESSNPFRDPKSRVYYYQIKGIGHKETKECHETFQILRLTNLTNEDVAGHGTEEDETNLWKKQGIRWTIIEEKYLSFCDLQMSQCWGEFRVKFLSWLLLRSVNR